MRDAAEELSGMCAINEDAVAALTLLHRLVSAENPTTRTAEVSR